MKKAKGLCLGLLALLLAACSQVGEQPGGELETLGVITVGGGCPLVDAILAADTDSAVGGCPAGSGADTVVLEAGTTYTLRLPYAGTPNGLPTITSELVIEGSDAIIERARESALDFRIMEVAEGGQLTLRDLSLQGGAHFDPNPMTDLAGGGLLNRGQADLENVTVRANSADSAGGILNQGALSLTDSRVEGNRSDSNGGGIRNEASLTVIRSAVVNNSTDGSGGGISNWGQLALEHTTVDGNSSGTFGGGLFNRGSATVDSSLISRNDTGLSAGGVHNFADSDLIILNSTISGNSSDDVVGGIFNEGGAVEVLFSTVAYNSAYEDSAVRNEGTLELSHTIVLEDAENDATECAWLGSGVVSKGYNLFNAADNTCTSPSSLDIVDVDPRLRPLADNGGLSRTHALEPGSPAIDAGYGRAVAPPFYDQRGPGFNRVVSELDIGAFEHGASEIPEGGSGCTEAWEIITNFAVYFDDRNCTYRPDPCLPNRCRFPPYIRFVPKWPCLSCELGLKFEDITDPVILVFSAPDLLDQPEALAELFDVGLYTPEGELIAEAELEHFETLSGPEPAPGYGLAVRSGLGAGEYLLRVEVDEQMQAELGEMSFDLTFLQEE